MIKRLFDITLSLLALILASPLMLMVALAVRVDSPGPVLFRQERIGLHGQPFQMLKFRTMVDGAALNGPYFTKAGDPRITQVGQVLRKFSLDELPQLANVLRGDMSLVGPRPDVPLQRDGYTEKEWNRRHQVRPGITGLAQATVRSSAQPGERKALDLEYVEKASFGFDLKILLWTVKQVFRGGSY